MIEKMKKLKFIKLWLFIGWIQIGLVIIFSLIPSPSDIPDIIGLDKLMHFSAYAFMMFWFGLCFFPGRTYNRIGYAIIIMGVFLELIQGKIGYRSMSYFDMTSNALGVSLGWVLARTRISSALVYIENSLADKHP